MNRMKSIESAHRRYLQKKLAKPPQHGPQSGPSEYERKQRSNVHEASKENSYTRAKNSGKPVPHGPGMTEKGHRGDYSSASYNRKKTGCGV